MSELPGGTSGSSRPGPSTPQGQTRGSSGGIRTPRDILNAREAREKAALEKQSQEAEQQRKIDLERRRSAERRAAAAGIAAPRDSGYRSATGRTPNEPPYLTPGSTSAPFSGSQYGAAGYTPTPSQQPQMSSTRARAPSNPSARVPVPPPQPQPGPASTPYSQPSSSQSRPPQPPLPPLPSQASTQQQQERQQTSSVPPMNQPTNQPPPQSIPSGQPRASGFPHAFERWEMLSAQWEGVTSHWVRVLEIHVQELGNNADRPTVEHMSRYITDLSAAGANLFHAVVELQRLRASSERKFQRWFFETRDQQSLHVEEIARLNKELETERQRSAGAVLSAEFEKQRAEMKREMQIAKDEARRAWEELGRREDMEREQQYALREGHPVFVGGVQVLPSSVVERGASLRQSAGRDVQAQPASSGAQPAMGGQEYDLQQDEPSPTDTDPFTERSKEGYRPIQTSIAPYSAGYQPQPPTTRDQPTSAAAQQQQFYHQPGTYLHSPASGPAPAPLLVPPTSRSAGAFSSESEEEPAPEIDEHGNVRRDASGRPIPFRAGPRPSAASSGTRTGTSGVGSGGMTAATTQSMPPPPEIGMSIRRQMMPEVVSSPSPESSDEEGEEYDPYREAQYQGPSSRGQAYQQGGPGVGGVYGGMDWDEMEAARMQRLTEHPTRLSDVIEEDERSTRSRTSPGGY